ncbi:MAG: PDZ domain-containing protein, partial [Planctomycetes bacterium]|nr:PDZ domain-containing protein [Planctomycetota bacterium]
MNATKSNRIIGASVAGVGMALAMFAGTALGACPPDADRTAAKEYRAARTSQMCCMIACGDADTCTPPSDSKNTGKQVEIERRVIIRGGPEGIHFGDVSFGDLDFDGDNAVHFGPEGTKRHVIRHIERGHNGTNVRTEVRIVGPRGGVREFGFDGDDKALSKAGSRLFFTQQIDDDTITIEIRNGTVTATINGKKVPKSRIRREGGTVSILNEDGEVVATVPVAMDGGGIVVGDLHASLLSILLRQPEAPPVMLGIRMSLVDDDTADALDLDEGEGILIVGVIEGLPAEHAGLQEHDVILRIKGVGLATQEKLHDVLLKKEPGDN